MDLDEKQYELGGVVFGLDCPIGLFEDGWTPTSAQLRTKRTAMPAGHGTRFGREVRGSATWGFKLFTNCDTEEDAWAALAELQDAWEDEDVLGVADVVVPLRYTVAGQTRRVYGRPGRWTATPNNFSLSGRIDITCDFDTVDQLVYEDELQTQTIGLQAPYDPDAGITIPTIVPFTTRPRRVSRDSTVTVGGTVPTPVWLTFNGPLANAEVEAVAKPKTATRPAFEGWTAELLDPVAENDPVTIDARVWARSATLRSGGGVRVSPRRTRISKMLLPPGQHDLIFTGDDVTGQASVTVSWHNAHQSPR